jgi:hypothetical protein
MSKSSMVETACYRLILPLTLSFHYSRSIVENAPYMIFRSDVSCPLGDFGALGKFW